MLKFINGVHFIDLANFSHNALGLFLETGSHQCKLRITSKATSFVLWFLFVFFSRNCFACMSVLQSALKLTRLLLSALCICSFQFSCDVVAERFLFLFNFLEVELL